jgi:xylose isomerase
MSEWLRFSVAFWHTMRGDGSDQFGLPTKVWPWETAENGDKNRAIATQTRRRLDAFFELVSKLGVEYWCFHDRDIAPELDSLADSNAALEQAVEYAAELQAKHGVKLLWGTAQLFKHPRYMHGAATSPDATVFAHAAAQVKAAMEATHRLHGEGYVFWGGREGYSSLLNTNMALEISNMARFLRMAVKYAKHIGFRGTLMLEPKPQEPSKHQYDWDAATTRAFLMANGLEKDFKLNIECNHVSNHSFPNVCFITTFKSSFRGFCASCRPPWLGIHAIMSYCTRLKLVFLVQSMLIKGIHKRGGTPTSFLPTPERLLSWGRCCYGAAALHLED